MRPPDRRGTRLGKAEVQDLALLDQIGNGSGHIFDRHGLVDAVLVEEIDADLCCLAMTDRPLRPVVTGER